ncbi:hypothetical protein [Microbacterium sp. HJ5]
MRAHLEMLMSGLAASLRRDRRRAVRRRSPRRARGTFVPVTPDAPALRLAH